VQVVTSSWCWHRWVSNTKTKIKN